METIHESCVHLYPAVLVLVTKAVKGYVYFIVFGISIIWQMNVSWVGIKLITSSIAI